MKTYYVAWLNGTSVAVGSKSEVMAKAREVARSENWRAFNETTKLRITRGSRQLFVAAYDLTA